MSRTGGALVVVVLLFVFVNRSAVAELAPGPVSAWLLDLLFGTE